MKSSKRIYLFLGVVFSLAGFWGASSLRAQDIRYERRFLYCSFPLQDGDTWKYEVFKEGKSAGELHVKVEGYTMVKANNLSSYMTEDSYFSYIPLFTLRYEDTYLKKKYTKKVLFSINAYYIYNESTRKYTPFLLSYLSPGDRYGDLIAVRSDYVKFDGDDHLVMTMRSTKDTTYQERYMDYVGLYYYRKGDVEYKLVSYQKKDGRREGCAIYDRVERRDNQ